MVLIFEIRRNIIMCKKSFLLISLVLVLALAGNSLADPNLVAHYALDGDANDTGNVAPATDGALYGNPGWTAGRVGLGGSIDFVEVDLGEGLYDGDFVQIPDANKLDITEELTVAFWLRVDDFGSSWQTIVIKGTAYDEQVWKFEQDGPELFPDGRILFGLETTPWCGARSISSVDDGKWHHIAGTYDNDGGTEESPAVQCLYIDGVQEVEQFSSAGLIPTNDLDLFINLVKDGRHFDGGCDDLRIYNRALSASEIWDLYNVPQLMAHFPDPNTETVGVASDALLSWTAGDYAVTHDVYLGTDEDAVTNATTASDEYIVRQEPNSYDPDLELGQIYYWRIDEVNSAGGPEWPGWVWSFTVASYYPSDPSPADGYQYAALDAELTWTEGYGALKHKVWFGTVYPPPYVGITDTNSSHDPGPLEPNETYYWKIYALDGPEGHKMGPDWSFRTTTGLRGHWTFDDGDGNKPADSSGNNNYAVFGVSPNSLPTWTTSGRIGGALEFDGDEDWVEVTHDPNFDITESMTVTVWIKINDFGGAYQSIIGKYDNWKFERGPEVGGLGGTILWVIEGGAPWTTYGSENIDDGEWHHLAGVYDGTTGEQYLYVDGVEDEMTSGTPPHPVPTSTNPLYIGSNGLDCVIDDLRVYDYNLTPAEIWDMASIPWLIAHNANPANRSTVATDADGLLTLSWAGGTEATSHDVYFGTDFNDVNDATRTHDPNNVLVSQGQPGTTYPAGPLETEQIYYWRIDEFGAPGGPYKGDIWQFTTANYFLVDDFESYEGNTDLRTVWVPVPDTLEYLETDIVHGGEKSMKMHYDGITTGIAETCRTYTNAQDWSASNSNVKALTLWFYGKEVSYAEQMYVKLEDAATNSAQVTYGNSNDLKVEEWQEWNIKLSDFGGVTLSQVKKIYIGFSISSVEHISDVYFDDIRVYPTRCVPEYAPADFTGDCIVDLNDLDIMTGDWLLSEYDVNAVTPSDANLVALYEFATDANFNDSSGNNHHGVGVNDVTIVYDAVRDSNVLSLDGDGDYVVITDSNTPGGPFDINDTITVACWIKVTEFDVDWQAIVTKGDNSWRMARASSGTGLGVEFACSGLSPYEWVSGDIRVNDGKWHHVAGVYDGSSQLRIYVDGILDYFENTSGSISNNTYNVLIGENEEASGREWDGQIDDVRIYNRALSHENIVSLAEKGPSVTQPLPRPEVDLYVDGKVDFKDYAVLANSWLEKQWWP